MTAPKKKAGTAPGSGPKIAPNQKAHGTKPRGKLSGHCASKDIPPRLRSVPREMREAKRWLLWSLNAGQKVPARRAWQEPGNWLTFDAALQQRRPGQHLGFVLGDGWAGIDVDGAWPDDDAGNTPDTMQEHGRVVWEACRGTYVERSPSGRGFKAFVRLDDDAPECQAQQALPGEHVGTEAYHKRGRWFAVTGRKLPDCGGDLFDAAAREGWHDAYARLRPHAAAPRAAAAPDDPEALADLERLHPYTAEREQELRDALAHVPSDCSRKEWLRFGIALQGMGWSGEHAERAFDLWHEWSKRSDKYPGEDECRERWNGLNSRSEVRIATIFAAAKKHGWKRSRPTPTTQANPRNELRAMSGSDYMAKHRSNATKTALGIVCPIGVSIVAGMGSTGKSTCIATLAAHVTNGKPCIPWEKATTKREPAGVLWLTSEESVGDLVMPRHRELGGDMNLLFVPVEPKPTECDADGAVIATDFDIEQELAPLLTSLRDAGTPVRLVVCDALPALVNWGNRSANSDVDVKRVLSRLRSIADEHECSIVGTQHWNKKVELDPAMRMNGAMAWRDSPRVSFVCEKVSDDQDSAAAIYVNKANDVPAVGTFYTQEVLRVLYEVEAETEDGLNLQVSARRADFGPRLLPKAKVLEQLKGSRELVARAPKHPTRIDQMTAIVAETFDLVDATELSARVVWGAVRAEYGHSPNSEEKHEIGQRLGIRGKPGSRVLVRRAPACGVGADL